MEEKNASLNVVAVQYYKVLPIFFRPWRGVFLLKFFLPCKVEASRHGMEESWLKLSRIRRVSAPEATNPKIKIRREVLKIFLRPIFLVAALNFFLDESSSEMGPHSHLTLAFSQHIDASGP